MGIVPHGEQPVSHGEAQVVLVELDKSRVELGGFAHAARKGICLELKPATQDCQTEGQQLQRQNIRIRNSSNTDGNYIYQYSHSPHCTGRR